jgi:pyrroline-5-carboxylate reductase
MHDDAAKLLLVGCGKMGGALLRRALDAALAGVTPPAAVVIDPANKPDDLKSFAGIRWLSAPDKIDPAFKPDIVVLAVKPQQIAAVLPAYARFKTSVFLSIAAGVPIAKVAALLNDAARPIVRAMPNLPASIGKGVSVAVTNKSVNPTQRNLCDGLLKALGDVAWVEDESLLDAVTALSGSGPAYVFALCEAMAAAGQSLGLSTELANRLARQTIIGSGALLDDVPDSAEALRKAVTSPGGTTEAALKQLLATGGLRDIVLKAMTAAAARCKELASSNA